MKTTILRQHLIDTYQVRLTTFVLMEMFLVADKGEIIFQQLYGFAKIVTKRMLNDTLVFELVSVSKQFTATAILLLKDK